VIDYRNFSNFDPPHLVRLWNAGLANQRAVFLPGDGTTMLEFFTLAKPYFDPAGLIMACDNAQPIGMVHAGFGRGADGNSLDHETGVICTLVVLPAHRRKGVGRELLHRAEEYLRQRGAKTILAGPLAPNNPFTFGLYGGADSAGLLESHGDARPFFEKHGYQVWKSCGVFQRQLKSGYIPPDVRFQNIRQKYDIIAAAYSKAGWWKECVLGPIEAVAYRLEDKDTKETVAQALLWDMDTYYQCWSAAGVGLISLEVPADRRRQGLAKYLLAQILRHLRDQPFNLFEARANLDDEAMLGLLKGLQFVQVDIGHCFKREA
jgi:GNAT superfamily N-acetyltransferase